MQAVKEVGEREVETVLDILTAPAKAANPSNDVPGVIALDQKEQDLLEDGENFEETLEKEVAAELESAKHAAKRYSFEGLEAVFSDEYNSQITSYLVTREDFMKRMSQSSIHNDKVLNKTLLALSSCFVTRHTPGLEADIARSVRYNLVLMSFLIDPKTPVLAFTRKGNYSEPTLDKICQYDVKFSDCTNAIAALEKYCRKGEGPIAVRPPNLDIVNASYSIFGLVCDYMMAVNMVCPVDGSTTAEQREVFKKAKARNPEITLSDVIYGQREEMFFKHILPRYKSYPAAISGFTHLMGNDFRESFMERVKAAREKRNACLRRDVYTRKQPSDYAASSCIVS